MTRAQSCPRRLASAAAFASLLGVVVAGTAGCSDDSSAQQVRRRSTTPPSSADGGTDASRPPPPPGVDSGAPPSDAGSSDAGSDAGAPTTGAHKPSCKYQAHKTGLSSLQQAGGLSFTVYAPASYDPNAGHAMVVILHGQDSNGVPELNAFWKAIADQEGLVVLAPKGSRAATTGDPAVANWNTADLSKVLALMSDLDDCYNVFVKKHLLWGFSEGGFYGYLLGVGAADRFSGLGMGGANMSFARQNGVSPAGAAWKIPVSHVHGTQDFNPIGVTYQDRADFQANGHTFTLHEHAGGHTISPAQVRAQYDDLKGSSSP